MPVIPFSIPTTLSGLQLISASAFEWIALVNLESTRAPTFGRFEPLNTYKLPALDHILVPQPTSFARPPFFDCWRAFASHMVFAPQFRGYKPLRLGNTQSALNTRQTTVVILAFLTLIITAWHFFGSPSRPTTPHLPVYAKQPKNWSVSGKGSLEGVTDFKKPENLTVVALVFYGRPTTVSILDCYLKVLIYVDLPFGKIADVLF